MRRAVLLWFIFIILVNSASASWYNNNYYNRYQVQIPTGQRPYQLQINVSNNSVVFGNTTHINVVCNQPGCSDLIFVLGNTTLQPYWREENTNSYPEYKLFWVNITDNSTHFQIYSNSTTLVIDQSNGYLTFPFWDNFSTNLNNWTISQSSPGNVQIFNDLLVLIGNNDYTTNGAVSLKDYQSPFRLRYKSKVSAVSSYFYQGMNTGLTSPAISGLETIYYTTLNDYLVYVDGISSTIGTYNTNNWYNSEIRLNGTGYKIVRNNSVLKTESWSQGANKKIVFDKYASGNTGYIDFIFIANYSEPEVIWGSWENVQYINKIITWGNNYTNDNEVSLILNDDLPKTIKFNVTTNFNPTNYSWFVNGVNQSHDFDNLSYTFISAGNYQIQVKMYNQSLDMYDFKNWTLSIFVFGGEPISNCGVHTILNNTNLAPTIEPTMPGTGERINGTTYYANNSEISLHVFAHANSVSATAGVFVYINDTLVSPRSGRPLGGAEFAYRGVDIDIPKYSYYRVEFFNYNYYEWREYKKDLDISGCNFPQNNDSLNGIIISFAFLIGIIVALAVCCIIKKR